MTRIRLSSSNFPDEVWGRLKAWAAIQAQAPLIPSVDECAAYVGLAAKDITGRPDALPPEVVTFYASETVEMIARLRKDAPLAGEEPANA